MSREEVTAKLQEELSCSICLDCFRDPVSIHCGHNFCRSCIVTYWDVGKKKSFSCPECRETSRKKILHPSRELKNIAEIVPKLASKGMRERVCERHQEPLKLFCKDDHTPICVVCDKSKEHQGHMVLPMEEATQDYMEKMQVQMKTVKQEKEKLLGFIAMGATRRKESLKTINSEMKKMASAFKQAHQFLDEQLQLLQVQWTSLQAAVEKGQEEHATRLSEDISQLDSLIAEAERRWQQPETKFLQEVNFTLTRVKKRKFHESVEIFPELEERLDSLIRQNVAIAQSLQKFEDTLPSELENCQRDFRAHLQTARGAPPFEVEEEESRSLTAKRKKDKNVIVPARNINSPQYQRTAEGSVKPFDFDLCSGIPSTPPSQPGKKHSGRDERTRENQHLARIVDIVKCLNLDTLEDGGRMCEKHSELLKVFCKDDQIPICLVCDLSKEHRHHTVIPIEEAAQDYKEQFQMELKTWKQMRETLQALKLAEEGRSWKSLEKLGNEGKNIVSEFEQLHQFLDDQEELLLARLEQLEKDVLKEEKTITSRLSEEISNLSDLLSEIEEKYKQPVSEFLQDLKSTLNRCEKQKSQQTVEHSPDLEKRLDTFSEKSMHLKEILRKFKASLSIELESTSLLKEEPGVRKGRMRLFELPYAEVEKRGRRVNVTLDPDTANPFLVLSADQKSVRLGDIWQDVPENPERFDTYPCVLGCEGLTSGRHYWEVEVGSGRYWAVGFAKESVNRKGEISPSPEEQIWALQQFGDRLEALTCPVTILPLCRCLRRVQVFLDYEEDRVAFFDADTSALIYIFSPAIFSQERIFPWLWVWPGAELRLYQ
ncbi:E3 ubiquitin-protein ligase TRIM7-like [Elgaria multicarinata webbii]|uniref:E3 ubiquitin-protein ligase TRIM7-like n=1 Tax=Elgaria multicarinata webbii TaxID=159646 RepID=UPI002FCCD0FE